MFYHSVVSLFTSIVIPPFIAPSYPNPSKSTSTHPYSTTTVHSNAFARFVKKHLPFSWLSQQLLWTFSTGLFGVLLLVCSFTKSVAGATIVIALIGFCWSCTNWLPFSIVRVLELLIQPGLMLTDQGSLERSSPTSFCERIAPPPQTVENLSSRPTQTRSCSNPLDPVVQVESTPRPRPPIYIRPRTLTKLPNLLRPSFPSRNPVPLNSLYKVPKDPLLPLPLSITPYLLHRTLQLLFNQPHRPPQLTSIYPRLPVHPLTQSRLHPSRILTRMVHSHLSILHNNPRSLGNQEIALR